LKPRRFIDTDVSKETAASLHVITRRQNLQRGPQNSQHSTQQLSIFFRKCWIFVLITGFKQKLSQCKKAHEGWSIAPFILGGFSFKSQPLYCRRKSLRYPLNLGMYGLHSQSVSLETRRNSCRACCLGGPAPLQGLYIHTHIRMYKSNTMPCDQGKYYYYCYYYYYLSPSPSPHHPVCLTKGP